MFVSQLHHGKPCCASTPALALAQKPPLFLQLLLLPVDFFYKRFCLLLQPVIAYKRICSLLQLLVWLAALCCYKSTTLQQPFLLPVDCCLLAKFISVLLCSHWHQSCLLSYKKILLVGTDS